MEATIGGAHFARLSPIQGDTFRPLHAVMQALQVERVTLCLEGAPVGTVTRSQVAAIAGVDQKGEPCT